MRTELPRIYAEIAYADDCKKMWHVKKLLNITLSAQPYLMLL